MVNDFIRWYKQADDIALTRISNFVIGEISKNKRLKDGKIYDVVIENDHEIQIIEFKNKRPVIADLIQLLNYGVSYKRTFPNSSSREISYKLIGTDLPYSDLFAALCLCFSDRIDVVAIQKSTEDKIIEGYNLFNEIIYG